MRPFPARASIAARTFRVPVKKAELGHLIELKAEREQLLRQKKCDSA